MDSVAWPYLRVTLHGTFFVVAFFLLKRIYDWRRETEPRHLGPARKPLLIRPWG